MRMSLLTLRALTEIMPPKVEQWADEARRLTVAELRRYRAQRRYALLVVLVHITRGRMLDDLVTMLIKSVRKIRHQAEADLQAWLDEQQESSEQLIVVLLDLARAHQNNEAALEFHQQTCAILAAAGGSDKIVRRCEARLKYRMRDWRPFARKHFVNRRAALMDLAEVLPLKAMPGSQGVLNALSTIVSARSYREEFIKVTPRLDESFLRRSWHKHVCDPDEPGVYNRRILEVAVFFELADALQAGEIYVPGSCNYGLSCIKVRNATQDFFHNPPQPAFSLASLTRDAHSLGFPTAYTSLARLSPQQLKPIKLSHF